MRQIFIFTAGAPEARRHLDDSIKKMVPASLLDNSLSAQETMYFKSLLENKDGFFAWGAVPGTRNKPNWEDMQPGDIILTVYDNYYHYISTVIEKVNSFDLAASIWGINDSGCTWQYMYFLTKPQPINLPVPNSLVAEFLNKSYRGFTKISTHRIDNIIERFGSIENFFQEIFITTIFPVSMEYRVNIAELKATIIQEEGAEFEDTRDKVVTEIVRRRGQPKFRQDLLKAYNSKCAVTGCDVEFVLEAAHIVGYTGKPSNSINNGILLRADIHTLFDLGKLKIDENAKIHICRDLINTSYWQYNGKKASFPNDNIKAPSIKLLITKFKNTF